MTCNFMTLSTVFLLSQTDGRVKWKVLNFLSELQIRGFDDNHEVISDDCQCKRS